MQSFFETAESVRYHHYQIEYIQRHEIVCPKYYFADGRTIMVIPWYLIPGRRLPIQVYLYATNLYSTSPELGQRAVAKATRLKFNLTTFSHSTVCRSFRRIEQAQADALKRVHGDEFKINNERLALVTANEKQNITAVSDEDVSNDPPFAGKRFPSVKDTTIRREKITEFLHVFHTIIATADTVTDIECAGCQFMKKWLSQTQKLLL